MTYFLRRLATLVSCVIVMITVFVYLTEIQLYTEVVIFTDRIGLLAHYEQTVQRHCSDNVTYPADQPSCTNDIITAYMGREGRFPDKGQWCDLHKEFPGPRYESSICRLPILNLPSLPLLQYLQTHPNTSNIVLFGDSRGRRFYDALMRHLTLEQIGYSCNVLITGSQQKYWSADYFVDSSRGIHPRDLKSKPRTCSTCVNSLSECILIKNKNTRVNIYSTLPPKIRIEYIALLIGDTEGILPDEEMCKTTPKRELCNVKTMQEFLFKIYFKNQMPDVFIHFSSFAHDVIHKTEEFQVTLQNFVQLVKETVPTSTKYMFVTSEPALISEISIFHISHRRYENGMSYNEKIQLFNHLLFSAVNKIRSGDVIGKGRREGLRENFLGWFDLYNVGSLATKAFWMRGKDGMHFEPVWYDTIIEYLFHAL